MTASPHNVGNTVVRLFSHAWTAIVALLAISLVPREGHAQSVWPPPATQMQVPLWPRTPPGAGPAVGQEAVHFSVDPNTGVKKLVGGAPYVYIENVSQPTITIYTPTAKNTGAAVIVYPGGGFSVLAIDIEGTEICSWLTSNGVSCVLLKYRVPCKPVGAYRDCPQAHQDAQRAMRIVRSRASDWNINPRKIGVMGFSAGAHMAIMSSTQFARVYPAVDGIDSISTRPDFALVLYPGRVAYRQTKFVPNPDIRVTTQTPPTFLVHAYDDDMNLVENSLLYATALRKAGVNTEVHIYAKGGHAFGVRRTGLSSAEWPRLAEAWLKTIGILGG